MNQAQAAQPPQGVPPQAVMMQIISGFWVSQLVLVAAKLGLADLLKDGPRMVAELAKEAGADADALYRVLRALAAVGIFVEDEQGRFASTPVAETLRHDVPGSLRAFAMAELGQEHYQAWGNLLHSVKTGGIAFDDHFGQPVWKYYAEHPEDAAVFNDAMTGLTEMVNAAAVAAYDFSGFKTVVDIGGGHGALLAAILKAHPAMRGVLFDLPHVAEGAKATFDRAGVGGQVEITSGDFFSSVAAGGDVYLMKFILHDWDDQRSVAIMKNIHRAMAPGGKLLVLEQIVPAGNTPSFSKFIDINMLVMTGGRERSEQEFAALFAAAGFKLTRVVPTDSPFCVIEAERA